MQVEYLHARLQQLRERTNDTEHLIELELDQRRNELVSLDLILTCLATACGFVAMIGGIFGEHAACSSLLSCMPNAGLDVPAWKYVCSVSVPRH